MKLWKVFIAGIWTESPIFVILIGLCPTLAISTSIKNAIGMGMSAMAVLVCSNAMISLFNKFFPKKIRIPCFIVVVATFVTLVQLFLAAYFPDINEALGIFIPLIVVNCIILGRAEAFASKNGVLPSILDGVGMGLGFTLALLIISTIREVSGSWSFFGTPISSSGFDPAAVMIMAPGAFMVLGLLLGFLKYRRLKKQERD